MRIPLWSKMRLALRIALVVVGSLIVAMFSDKAMNFFVTPPEVIFFQRDWLVDSLRDIRDDIVATPNDARAAILRNLPSAKWLDATLHDSAPESADLREGGELTQLHRQIATALGLAPGDVVISADKVLNPARSVHPIAVVLPELPAVIHDVPSAFRTHTLSNDLRIALRIDAAQWILVTLRSDGNEDMRMARNVALPLLVLLIIALLSIWIARGVARPLDDLAAAAEKLGRDRELSLVGKFNAPELQAIGETFNAMQFRLKQFLDDRLQMIAAISHDLRTPLTRLRLFAEYLGDQEQRRQVLSDIDDMEAMMRATLTFAGNELQDEARGAIDLAAMLISLCDTAADAGCRVVYDGPDHASLVGRPVAIRRAFANLIDNGCKFADTVQVSLRDDADTIVVEVADDGPGIPANKREAAFRPFTRLETSRNRETGGTGLGLTIARDVVLAHRGEIRLDAAATGGLLVSVRLPKAT